MFTGSICSHVSGAIIEHAVDAVVVAPGEAVVPNRSRAKPAVDVPMGSASGVSDLERDIEAVSDLGETW